MDSNCAKASELWVNFKKGDKKAFNNLYGMYADALYLFGKSYTSDSGLVEDSIHDLFVELYSRRKKLPEARNVKNYLFTVLRRKITELLKKRTLVISSGDNHFVKICRDQEVSTEAEIIQKEEKEEFGLLLSNAMDKLTPRQRKGVSMRFYENSSYEEMALGLDISVETARTLIYKSLKRIRANLP